MGADRSEQRSAMALLPPHLYSFNPSPTAAGANPNSLRSAPTRLMPPKHPSSTALPAHQQARMPSSSFVESSPSRTSINRCNVMVASPSELPPPSIKLFSPQYYAGCAMGGLLACGLTHLAVTPLDVVKCNIQIDPIKYSGTIGAVRTVIREQGFLGLTRGWAPTFVGYGAQGAAKYGFYEFFKKYYTDLAGPELGEKHKTALYLAGSASAELLADIALCPFEAVKVRVQTQPGFARGLSDGLPKLVRMEGIGGLYKGIGALWARQVPYTMMKFATFENTVEAFYTHVIPYSKEECSVLTQLGVSFTSGYIAGVACAVISHPADNLVSFLNNSTGATVGQAVKQMGLWNLLTRGLPLRIAMVGTLTAAQWSIYDSFKVFLGIPTTGGPSNDKPLPLPPAASSSTTLS